MNQTHSSSHQVGQLVRHEGRIWRVGLINPSRMRLDPVQGKPVYIKDGAGRNANVGGHTFTDYGSPINVSPNSLLETVTEESLTREAQARVERLKEHSMAVAEMPVADKKKKATSPKEQAVQGKNAQANADRRKAQADRRGTGEAKEPKVQNDCLCGCGGKTGGSFVMGHDARYKGWMIKLERGKIKPTDLPEAVQKANKFVKTETGYRATKHYSGEAWPVNGKTGYDNPKE